MEACRLETIVRNAMMMAANASAKDAHSLHMEGSVGHIAAELLKQALSNEEIEKALADYKEKNGYV